MDYSQLSKSELISHDTGKEEAQYNLLSEAMGFIENHPVETVAASIAIVAGFYNAGKLAAYATRRGESDLNNITLGIREHLRNSTRTEKDFVNAYYKPASNGEHEQLFYYVPGAHRGLNTEILARESGGHGGSAKSIVSGEFNFGPEAGLSGESIPKAMISERQLSEMPASVVRPEQPVAYGDLGAHLHPDLVLSRQAKFGQIFENEIHTSKIGEVNKIPDIVTEVPKVKE